MKKKVKLEAWVHDTGEIHYRNEGFNGFGNNWERFPEMDIIRTVEVADEPKKARDYLKNKAGICVPFYPDMGEKPGMGSTHVREVIPGSVQVTKMDVVNAWGNLDSMPGDLDKLLRQLGLEDA